MTDNVVSIGTRKTLTEENRELERAKEMYDKLEAESKHTHARYALEQLDRIKSLIQNGKIDGFIILARNPENGLFFSEIAINGQITNADVHLAYAGQLEALKLEVLDDASAGPHMDINGEYFGFVKPERIDIEEDE